MRDRERKIYIERGRNRERERERKEKRKNELVVVLGVTSLCFFARHPPFDIPDETGKIFPMTHFSLFLQ